MALEVTKRPEKTLENGFVSRFNGSRTPLIYELSSDLYPTNNVDLFGNITNIEYKANKLGTEITFSSFVALLNITDNNFVLINDTNTSLDGGVYRVKELTGSSSLILDTNYSGTWNSSGTGQRNYKGYKGLVNVYVGSPEYHPYNIGGEKPRYLAGVIEVDFDSSNNGIANVREFIKPDINSKFDSDFENSRYAWTSFFIKYAETYDNIDTDIVFTRDTLENCLPFSDFIDGGFDNGLDNWNQKQYNNFDTDFVGSIGNVSVNLVGSDNDSSILYQAKKLVAGNKYEIDIYLSGNKRVTVRAFGLNNSQTEVDELSLISIVNDDNGKLIFYPNKNYDDVGITITKTYPSDNITVSQLSISANNGVVSPCDYSSFAVFGTKQFQDNLGGNFGDYVLNKVDEFVTPKTLTHFEKKTLFYTSKDVKGDFTGFKNYVSTIIPAGLFPLSDNSDNVYLEFNTFDAQGNQVDTALRINIDNLSDGVYNIDLDSLVLKDFYSGYCQFVYIPANSFLDADYGTFEDDNTANWNISTVAPFGSAVTLISTHPRTGTYAGGFTISVNGVNPSGVYESFDFDTSVETVVGRTYELRAYIYNDANVSPSLNENLNVFLKLKGTNIESNKYFVSYSDVDNEYKELYLSFEATQTSYQVTLCTELINDSPDIAAGGTFTLDDITFKGPIEYASEQKPIVLDPNCKGYYKSNTLRWLNDIGGWETWIFKQYQTVKEDYKRSEIKHDIFTDFDNYFINGEAQYNTNSVESRKSVTLRSHLLDDDDFKNVSQIKRSLNVQMLMDSGKWQTVSIRNGSFVIIEENEKIHEISFDVQLPDTLTQEL